MKTRWTEILKTLLVAMVGALLAILLYTGLQSMEESAPKEGTSAVNEIRLGENVSLPDIIAKTVPSVVQISRDSITGTALGSGVIIDSALGYVVTNYHVVQDNGELTVSLADGRVSKAQRIGGDPDADIAIIQLEDKSRLTAMELGDSSTLKVGQTAIAIGSPLSTDFANTVTVGVISALSRDLTITNAQGVQVLMTVLQTDAAINPGNSGGALVNSLGQLIGINSAKISIAGVEGLGFAIPINTVKPLAEEIITTGKVTRPYLGVSGLVDITAAMAEYYDVAEGVLIGAVAANSPADIAGLRANDIILQIGGEDIRTGAQLRSVLFRQKPGDRVTLKISRNGSLQDVRVTLK